MPRLYTSRLAILAGPAVIVMVGGIMLWRSWDTWPDPLVDFGIQLYSSWQLAAGKVLYRDIAYFNGPLAPYLNAGLFKIFGVSMRAVEIANLFILAAIVAMLYRLIARISGRFAATVCGVVFMILFAFAQTGPFGSFNYVCPYTHEVTHGMLLLLASMMLVIEYQRRERMIYVAAMGLCAGLLFLTKAEMFLGIAGPVIAMAMTLRARATKLKQVVALSATFITCAIVPVLIAMLLLSPRGVLGTWPWLFDSQIRSLHFYQWCLGTNDWGTNLSRMAAWFLMITGVFASAAGITLMLRRGANDSIALAAIAGVVTCAVLVFWPPDWSDASRPWPLFMIASAVITWRRVVDPDERSIRIGFTMLALALLSKMFLNARIWQYGFVLAMPATLLLVEILVNALPKWIESRGGSGRFMRAVALGAIAAWCVFYVNRFEMLWARKTYIVSAAGDQFRGDLRGAQVAAVLKSIEEVVGKDESLASLPQGLMINYLSRRACPSRYAFFNPPEVLAIGEQAIVRDWQAHPPDWVILDNRAVRNNAFEFFPGDGYGQEIYEWLSKNYHVHATTKMGEFTLLKRGNKS